MSLSLILLTGIVIVVIKLMIFEGSVVRRNQMHQSDSVYEVGTMDEEDFRQMDVRVQQWISGLVS